MELNRLSPRSNEDPPDPMAGLKTTNVLLMIAQVLFAIFILPAYMNPQEAALASLSVMFPSLLYYAFPNAFKGESCKELINNIFTIFIGLGGFLFALNLYGAIVQGDSEGMVLWLHVWLLPYLINTTLVFITHWEFEANKKKMMPVVSLSQESLLKVNSV